MFKDLQVRPIRPLETTYVVTWSILQKMWASSCWKRRTLVRPVSVPDSSFLCRTPKSASLRGSSLHERGLWLNIRLQDSQRARGKSEKKPNNNQMTMTWIWFTTSGEMASNVYTLNFTSARGSSWAWAQRCLLPRERRTCFHCSVASGQMSPTVCCYRCWGKLLPESLFSSTPPRQMTKTT